MKILKEEIQHISIRNIIPDENQPRRYFDPSKMRFLKDSIKKYGIMNPLTVEKIGEKFMLVDGERRYRASKELGLKDVPVMIIAPQSAIDRIIQQFHIQEQHEEWSATEKAVVVNQLALEMKISMQKLADLLGIDDTVAKRYIAFSQLLSKNEFEKSEISIHWALPILQVSKLAQKIYEKVFEKSLPKQSLKKIQEIIIKQAKYGEISGPTKLSKVRDSFTQDPKSIEKFIEEGTPISQMFLETKAKPAYHLRNIVNNARALSSHIIPYLEDASVVPDEVERYTLKHAYSALKKFIDKFD